MLQHSNSIDSHGVSDSMDSETIFGLTEMDRI